MIWRCDLVPQYEAYKNEINAAIQKVLSSGCYTLANELKTFEKDFAEFLGIKHSVGVANGTDGLTLALMALGIGRGDEVITTPFTAIPTLSAIIDSGAKPIFVDVDPDTYLLDIQKVIKALSPCTKAIIPVHIFGNVVDIPELRRMVGNEINIIEDACQAHGSNFKGFHAGTMGDLGVYSFYPTKNLGGYGDGGMVVTNNPELMEKLKLLRMYGMVDKDHIIIHGINSRLDEIQAAILRVKLKHLDKMNNKRQLIAERYHQELSSYWFKPQLIKDHVFCNYHVYVTRFSGNRERLIDYLDSQQITNQCLLHASLTSAKSKSISWILSRRFPHNRAALPRNHSSNNVSRVIA